MADEPGPVYRASKRRFPWADVRGFEIDQRTGREIFVLLKETPGTAYRSSRSPPDGFRPRRSAPSSSGTGGVHRR